MKSRSIPKIVPIIILLFVVICACFPPGTSESLNESNNNSTVSSIGTAVVSEDYPVAGEYSPENVSESAVREQENFCECMDEAPESCECASKGSDDVVDPVEPNDIEELHAQIDETLASGRTAFLFFYTDWCGYSKKQQPILEELEAEYGDKVEFIWLNVENHTESAREFSVNSYPTMFWIKGKESSGIYDFERFGGYKGKFELEYAMGLSADATESKTITGQFEKTASSLQTENINWKDEIERVKSEVQLQKINRSALFELLKKDAAIERLHIHAQDLGYLEIVDAEKTVYNNSLSMYIAKYESQDNVEGYLIRTEYQDTNSTHFVELNGTSLVIYSDDLSKTNAELNEIIAKTFCVFACIEPGVIDEPFWAAFEKTFEVSTPWGIKVACGAWNAPDGDLVDFLGCEAAVADTLILKPIFSLSMFVGQSLECMENCHNNCCTFANSMTIAQCGSLYGEQSMRGADPYSYEDSDGATYCYFGLHKNPYSDNIIECCRYTVRDSWNGDNIIRYYNDAAGNPEQYWDEWTLLDEIPCAAECTEDLYYNPTITCTQYGMHCIPDTTPVNIMEFCQEEGFEKGACGVPPSYCDAPEIMDFKTFELYPGDAACWDCSKLNGAECVDDSDCISRNCVPSCTGGPNYCCDVSSQAWSDTEGCISKCECSGDEDCRECQRCVDGRCEDDDSMISQEQLDQGYVCCNGRFYEPLGDILGACCDDDDCDTAAGQMCDDHQCRKTSGACYYAEECAPGYVCDSCEGQETHCCPEGMKWNGKICAPECYDTCPDYQCMQDYNGYEYSCRACSGSEGGLCEQDPVTACWYGDPDATNSPCERCDGDCVRGFCDSSMGCAEYRLPSDHGYMNCRWDDSLNCGCPDTCEGVVRLYNSVDFIFEDEEAYLYEGCIYHGCHNCGSDDLMCESGSCVSGDPITNFVYNDAMCVPDTTTLYNDYLKPNPAYPNTDFCPFLTDSYIETCVPSSQKFTFSDEGGGFCIESGVSSPPSFFDEHRWTAGYNLEYMADAGTEYGYPLREPLCYEEEDGRCYEEDDGRYVVRECVPPVPSNYYICGNDCYDPDYYECCKGDSLVEKDTDGDGIQDHKCCVAGIEPHTGIDPNDRGVYNKNVISYDKVDIMNDPEHCGGCGWTCTEMENGACVDMERDYSHVCFGSQPQCCDGMCIEPSPALTIYSAWNPATVIEGANLSLTARIRYDDPYSYGKTFPATVTFSVEGEIIETGEVSLVPETIQNISFFWFADRSPGYYNYSIALDIDPDISICGDMINNWSVQVREKPDLTVGTVQTNKTTFHSGENLSVSADIQNLGPTDSNAFFTTFSIDGQLESMNITSVPAGESRTVEFNWTAMYGEHMLSIRVDGYPLPGGMIPESDEDNNIGILELNLTSKGNTTPILTYPFIKGYYDGIEPDIGNNSTLFEYRVNYIDFDNDLPETGSPQVWIDVNGDGDTLDLIEGFAEGGFSMSELDPGDARCSDGKIYHYNTSLPLSTRLGFVFTARDDTGLEATPLNSTRKGPTIEGIAEPVIITVYGNLTSGYAPLAVEFQALTGGNPTSWHWEFGDGESSDEQNATHTYTTTGSFDVGLNVSNHYGSDSMEIPEYIRVSGPKARLSSNRTSGPAPLSVQFFDKSLGNPDEFAWDFGDGASSTERDPVHTYQTLGVYKVVHTVSNDYGSDSNVKYDYIIVHDPAVPGFVKISDIRSSPVLVSGDFVLYHYYYSDYYTHEEISSLYLYNARNGSTSQVAGNTSAIWGGFDIWNDLIVWSDMDTNNIFLHNLTANQTLQITDDPVESEMKSLVQVSENFIVWTERSGEIKYYNFTSGTIESLGLYFNEPIIQLSGDLLVWQELLSSQPEIHMYNLASGESRDIAEISQYSTEPDIGSDHIVWMDVRYVDEEPSDGVYAYNVETRELKPVIIGQPSIECSPNPAVSGNRVVAEYHQWGDGPFYADSGSGLELGGNERIYLHDLVHEKTVRVIEKNGWITHPSISGDLIVWTDSDGIYLFNLGNKTVLSAFTADVTEGHFPLEVQFGAIFPGADVWAWDFNGDGVTDSNERMPVYTYNSPGNYSVTLNVTSMFGIAHHTKEKYIYVYVGEPPSITSISPSEGYQGNTLEGIDLFGENFRDGALVNFTRGTAYIIPSDTLFNSGNWITCNLTIPDDAEPGLWDVTVTNPDGQSDTLDDGFEVISDDEFAADSIALFRPSKARWFFDNDFDGIMDRSFYWGQDGDKPIAGDWNGDGKSEIARFRPSSGRWFFDYNLDGTTDNTFRWGGNNMPLTGDWNGNGRTGIARYWQSNARWYFDYNLDGTTDKTFWWGKDYVDTPLTGDWNGNGKTGIARFRPSTGRWYFDYNLDTKTDKTFVWGKEGDVLLAGDWNGNGKTGIARFRPSTGRWYFDYNLDTKTDKTFVWGKEGDVLLAGDWNGNGKTGIGRYRPSSGRWYFDYDLDGTTDESFVWGSKNDEPITGHWV